MNKLSSEDSIILSIFNYLLNDPRERKSHGNKTKSKCHLGKKHGCDIEMVAGIGKDGKRFQKGRRMYIECKGIPKTSSSREVYFVYALGQLITRMKFDHFIKNKQSKRNAESYALGYDGTTAQLALRRIPKAFAKEYNIIIFSVANSGLVRKGTGKDINTDMEYSKYDFEKKIKN